MFPVFAFKVMHRVILLTRSGSRKNIGGLAPHHAFGRQQRTELLCPIVQH